MGETYFSLFSNCIPVAGSRRSLICDVFRERFKYIPNSLYHILKLTHLKSIEQIKNVFNNENDDDIDEYFKFLEENEFGHFCQKEEIKLFPKLSLDYELPSLITNCIIDVNNSSMHDYDKIFTNLDELLCPYIQFRFFEAKTITEVDNILKLSENTFLQSIHLIIKYTDLITFEGILDLYNKYPISIIEIYGSPRAIFEANLENMKTYPIIFILTNISSELHCGKINNMKFNTNIISFSEAQKFNSCLNQKISIDVNGEIKNCPSMSKSYGNIKDSSLKQAFDKEGYKDVWDINKDKIIGCKKCEFRYICTDCRAYIEDPMNNLSKPLKCSYNPDTAVWEKWSTNPLKQNAIEYYGMQELIKNEVE